MLRGAIDFISCYAWKTAAPPCFGASEGGRCFNYKGKNRSVANKMACMTEDIAPALPGRGCRMTKGGK